MEFRRFWVKETRHSEDVSAKKKCCLYPYRGTRQRGAIGMTARNCAYGANKQWSIGRKNFTHRGLADCHAVNVPPSRDAPAEAPHAPASSALDRAADTTTLSATTSIAITASHYVVAAATDPRPLVSRRFPARGRADVLAPLELELGWTLAEVK